MPEPVVADAPPAPPGPSRKKRLIPVVLAVAAAVAGWYLWAHHGRVSTDDAQVDAEVLPVPVRIGGVVAQVLFNENDEVKEGQVLIQLDDEPQKVKVAQAEAALAAAQAAAEAAEADAAIAEINATGNLALARAGLSTAASGSSTARSQIGEAEAALAGAEAAKRQSQLDHDRVEGLYKSGATTQNALDQATTALTLATANLEAARARLATLQSSASQATSRVQEASVRVKQTSDVDVVVRQARARARVAEAQVQTAKAALDMARLDLSYTRVVAPAAGIASKKTVIVGQNLMAGQAVAQLVTPKRWVTANFKETQLEDMRPGQPVELSVDTFSSIKLHGTVESLAGGTGSRFALLPPDNASGNFTKVVQRIPVRIALQEVPPGIVLRPGMNVDLTVDVRRH